MSGHNLPEDMRQAQIVYSSVDNSHALTFAGAHTFSGANTHSGAMTLSSTLTTTGMITSTVTMGTSTSTRAFTGTTTSSSVDTGTSIRPIYNSHTATGAGSVGHRVEFAMTTNVALGGWSNALKGNVTYGSSGRTTGLGSAVCAEITLSAGTSSGTYAPLEAEYTMASGALTGTASSFLYCNTAGAARSTFDTNGYLIHIGTGPTAAATKFLSLTSQTAKCLIGSSTRYMVLSQMEDGLGLGVSGTAVVLGTSTTKKAIAIYTTSASTTSTSIEPIYSQHTATGAGGVGHRAYFLLQAQAALGGWSNALKAQVTYNASGRTTGLGSVINAEMDLSAGTTQGTYAPVEVHLNLPSSASLGTCSSFFYVEAGGTDKANIDTSGYLFNFQGLTEGSNKLIDSDGSPTATGGIRCKLGTGEIWLLYRDTAPA